MDYGQHVRDFEERKRRRADLEQHRLTGGRLDPAIVRGLQRFQIGEEGDGASLLRLFRPIVGDVFFRRAERIRHHARPLPARPHDAATLVAVNDAERVVGRRP
jgi:hypothetical protein